MEKTTTTMLAKIALTPLGKNPPWLVIRLTSKSLSGHSPTTKRVPSTRNAMIAKTLMPANQYSNSP